MESLVWLLGGLKNPKNGTLKKPACYYFQSYKRRLVAQFCYFAIFSSFFIMNQSWVISSQGKYMISGWTYLQLDSKRPQNSQKVDLDHVSENAQIWQFLLFYGSNWGQLSVKSSGEGLYHLYVQPWYVWYHKKYTCKNLPLIRLETRGNERERATSAFTGWLKGN